MSVLAKKFDSIDSRAKKILPKIICDGRPYQITVLMDTLKTTGDIPIDFQLEHIKTKRSIALRKKEKCHGHFELEFDQVPFAGICHLNVSIIEANVIVPESFQYFELKVKEHAESGCYHCEEADTPSGKKLLILNHYYKTNYVYQNLCPPK